VLAEVDTRVRSQDRIRSLNQGGQSFRTDPLPKKSGYTQPVVPAPDQQSRSAGFHC